MSEPTTYKGVTRHTFALARCIMHLRNAETYAVTLSREKDVQFKSRATLNRIAHRCKAAVGEFTFLLTPASLKVMQEDMLSDEITLQMESISDMLLALPKGTRDQAEAYITGLYNTYALNKK